jgi:hypothetical protein
VAPLRPLPLVPLRLRDVMVPNLTRGLETARGGASDLR